ncbi:MAG: universal stress protein [Candidatus Sulfotelmatobacter sp.]
MPTVAEVTRVSLKTILFPTDFSSASSAALPFAVALARTYGSTLVVMHALPPEPHRQVVLDQLPAENDRVWQDARHKLSEFAHDRNLGHTACRVLLERGDLADVIPELIQEQAVDLVVLGTHGRRGVSKLVLGSGAEKIYRTAPCPVLTVGPKVHGGDWKLRRILCPVDVVEDPEPFLHYALSLAEENQAEFIVLQAIPLVPWQHRAAVEAQMRERLERLIPQESKDWCRPQFLVRWEHPAEAVLLAAADRESDLIVMGVRKARAARLSAHLPWPVASEVVSRAPCPVLTARI